jgi:hypothetical protein
MLIALEILFNIIVFSTAMFFTSLTVEKIYAGRFRKVLFPVLLTVMVAVFLHPRLILGILEAFQKVTVAHLCIVLLGGIFSGVFISFFCVFFRLVQIGLIKLLSHS